MIGQVRSSLQKKLEKKDIYIYPTLTYTVTTLSRMPVGIDVRPRSSQSNVIALSITQPTLCASCAPSTGKKRKKETGRWDTKNKYWTIWMQLSALPYREIRKRMARTDFSTRSKTNEGFLYTCTNERRIVFLCV